MQHDSRIELAGGVFRMGSADPDQPADSGAEGRVESGGACCAPGNAQPSPPTNRSDPDGERPAHLVSISPFALSAYTVTNEQFLEFADATGYRTIAENEDWSFVFGGHLPDDFPPTQAVAGAPWWRKVEGSHWRHPTGPDTTIDAILDHPVVHVSWDDALAYALWAEGRLPTEAEWEYAARGGLEDQVFPWGDELEPGGEHRMNVFQGLFPGEDLGSDGFTGTAPVDSYEPNGFGLYNMTGNVWEWCADWFAADTYSRRATADGPVANPAGPASGQARVMRGGSYLCHHSYCSRYRVAGRSGNGQDASAGNVGFRVAFDLEIS